MLSVANATNISGAVFNDFFFLYLVFHTKNILVNVSIFNAATMDYVTVL